jgi:hypothetical protein
MSEVILIPTASKLAELISVAIDMETVSIWQAGPPEQRVDDLIYVYPDQLDELIAALRKAKLALSDGHGAQGDPATVPDKAHETPVRQAIVPRHSGRAA